MHAEDVNYWKTGQSSPDTWIEKAKAELRAAGARDIEEAFGSSDGRAAYLLAWSFAGDRFRAVWPVLTPRVKTPANERAAKIQAATMLYHDIKAKAVSAKVHGARAAYFQYLALPDGRTAAQLAAPELSERYPRLLVAPQE